MAELILYDLSTVVPVDDIFSVCAGPQQYTRQVFEQLCMRYAFRVRYLSITAAGSADESQWEDVYNSFPHLLELQRIKSIGELTRVTDELCQKRAKSVN